MPNSSGNRGSGSSHKHKKHYRPPPPPPPRRRKKKRPTSKTPEVPEFVEVRKKVFSALQLMLPLVGLIVVLQTLVEFAYILFPLSLWSPKEELAKLGLLISHAWGLIFGLLFVLLPLAQLMPGWLLRLRAGLGWLALLCAVAYVCTLPLILRDTHRLYVTVSDLNASATKTVMDSRKNALTTIENLDGEEQLRANLLAQGLKEAELEQDEYAMRAQLKDYSENAHLRAETRLAKEEQDAHELLIKDALRWSLSAILAACCLTVFWYAGHSYRKAVSGTLKSSTDTGLVDPRDTQSWLAKQANKSDAPEATTPEESPKSEA